MTPDRFTAATHQEHDPGHQQWILNQTDCAPAGETESECGPSNRDGLYEWVVRVVSPARVTLFRATVEDFLNGYIEAPIVVEVGLDYGLAHLVQDAEKLLNSGVRRGYLVHFTRVGEGRRVEEFVRDLTADGRVMVAYANVRPAGGRRKRLSEPGISP